MEELDRLAGPPRCAIYARYSSKLQKDKSIEDQVAACTAKAEREGWIISEVYADRSKSGTSMAPRASLLKMLADAQSDSFNIVLTEGLDRLSRNQADTAHLYQAMQFVDVQIYTLADGFVNELHVGFKGLQHSLFIKDLGQKTRRGQEGTVRKGLISGSVAYGYRVVRSNATPTGGREVDPEQAEIVRRIFNEWNRGDSVLIIARRLNQEGKRTADGGLWRPSTIFGSDRSGTGILRNELYRGVNKWGKNQTRRAPDGTKVRRLAPKSNLVVVDVPDLRIVEDEVWFAARKRLDKSRNLPLHQRKRPKHLLSGKLVCEVCGNGYIIHGDSRYACSGRSAHGVCEVRRRFGREELEACVLNLIANQLLEPTLIAEYLCEYEVEHRKQSKQILEDARALEKRSSQIVDELDRLLCVLKSPETSGPAASLITAEINKLSVEKDGIDASLTDARSAPSEPLNVGEIEKSLRARITGLQSELEGQESEAAGAREAFRALIDRVVITPVGDPNQRTGQMSIRVEGKITSLLGESGSAQVHAILSCTSPRAGQYRAKDQWSVSGILEPESSYRNDELRKARVDRGALKYDTFLLEQLRIATSALTAADLSRTYLTSQNLVNTAELVRKQSHTFRQRLHDLKELGQADTVHLTGKHPQGWVLEGRKAELDPPAPLLRSEHQDNEVIFAELNHASRALTINDLTRAVLRLTGEKATPTRLAAIKCRLRTCLKHHREAGVVVPVNVPGSNTYGWVLAEREAELRPTSKGPTKPTSIDLQIRSTMDSSSVPLTAPEIAARVFAALPPSATKRKHTLRSVSNRVATFLRNHRRNGDLVPVVIKGKRAQGWTWVEERNAS